MTTVNALKVLLLAIVEGITEWLPISSTGHMLLLDNYITLDAYKEFKEMFFVVIQLGAILAVVLLFWNKLFPFKRNEENKVEIKKDTITLYLKTVVSIIPSGIVGIFFDDWMEEHLYTPLVISLALIIYGILFIVVERINKKRKPITKSVDDISYKRAIYIGLFQVLSLIPGTSRSGATIMGALLLSVDRVSAAEFTFFMSIPTMFGASLIKLLKFGFKFSQSEIMMLIEGTVVAFLVSLLVIKFLLSYIKKNDFTLFGIYRIILGLIIILSLLYGIK